MSVTIIYVTCYFKLHSSAAFPVSSVCFQAHITAFISVAARNKRTTHLISDRKIWWLEIKGNFLSSVTLKGTTRFKKYSSRLIFTAVFWGIDPDFLPSVEYIIYNRQLKDLCNKGLILGPFTVSGTTDWRVCFSSCGKEKVNP